MAAQTLLRLFHVFLGRRRIEKGGLAHGPILEQWPLGAIILDHGKMEIQPVKNIMAFVPRGLDNVRAMHYLGFKWNGGARSALGFGFLGALLLFQGNTLRP